MAAITPAEVPQKYFNTIDDLLLAILNVLPVPDGNAAHFLNGQYNWAAAGIAGGSGSVPSPSTAGAIIYADDLANNWLELPRNVVSYDTMGDRVSFRLNNGDNFFVGDCLISHNGVSLNFSTMINTPEVDTAKISLRDRINVLNKAGDNFLPFALRDITGAQSRVNLSNVNNINAYGDNLWFEYLNKKLVFNGGGQIGTYDNTPLYLFTNNTLRWSIENNGKLLPSVNNTYDIGSTSSYVKDIYAGGTVFAAHFNTGVVNWDLGNLVTAAVTLNTTRYIALTVGGTVYKLLTAN